MVQPIDPPFFRQVFPISRRQHGENHRGRADSFPRRHSLRSKASQETRGGDIPAQLR